MTCALPALQAPVALLACDKTEGCDSLASEAARASASAACVLALEGAQLHSSKELAVSDAPMGCCALWQLRCRAEFEVDAFSAVHEQVSCDSGKARQPRTRWLRVCLLVLLTAALSQAKVAAFVRRTPGGTVVLNRVDKVW